MKADSSTRRLLYLGLIALAHLALLFAFRLSAPLIASTKAKFSDLQFVTLSQPLKKPATVSTTRTAKIAPAAKDRIATKSATSPSLAVPNDHPAELQPEPITEPKLDFDALRQAAVRAEMEREKSPIERMNEARIKNHGLETKVDDAASKAQRADCRNAYAGAGLFAPLIIAADLVRDKGCKF